MIQSKLIQGKVDQGKVDQGKASEIRNITVHIYLYDMTGTERDELPNAKLNIAKVIVCHEKEKTFTRRGQSH